MYYTIHKHIYVYNIMFLPYLDSVSSLNSVTGLFLISTNLYENYLDFAEACFSAYLGLT